MSQKGFENDLVAICKSKITLTLNKPAYIGMFIVNYQCMNLLMIIAKIKKSSKSRLLFIHFNSLVMKLKLKMFMQILA